MINIVARPLIQYQNLPINSAYLFSFKYFGIDSCTYLIDVYNTDFAKKLTLDKADLFYIYRDINELDSDIVKYSIPNKTVSTEFGKELLRHLKNFIENNE